MDHTAFIKALGGAKKVSEALARRGIVVAPVTVRSWCLVGRMIPAKYWSDMAAIAEEQSIEISFAALAEAAAAASRREAA